MVVVVVVVTVTIAVKQWHHCSTTAQLQYSSDTMTAVVLE